MYCASFMKIPNFIFAGDRPRGPVPDELAAGVAGGENQPLEGSPARGPLLPILCQVEGTLPGGAATCSEGFVNCFLRVPQAVGPYCSCHAG